MGKSTRHGRLRRLSLSLSLSPLYYFSRSFSMFHFLFYTVRDGTVLQGDGK